MQSGPDRAESAFEAMVDADIDEITAGRLKTHVEMKIAAEMIDEGHNEAVVVINHPTGPCAPDGRQGCEITMPRLLPSDTRVAVWWKENGRMERLAFWGQR